MHVIAPLFAAGTSSHALSFAWKHLTKEGFCTILALLVVSIFSWTVIISKARQLYPRAPNEQKILLRLIEGPATRWISTGASRSMTALRLT